jgi:hypothetical protein
MRKKNGVDAVHVTEIKLTGASAGCKRRDRMLELEHKERTESTCRRMQARIQKPANTNS